MDLRNIKMVVSEIDGVITDGTVGFGEFNTPIFKKFCLKDFEAINLIKKTTSFGFISSDASINISMCKKRNIPFFFSEKNKMDVYTNNILRRFGLLPDNILYVGYSYSDIECLRISGFSACPEDAPEKVRNSADYVIPVYGGSGVLCYLCELLHDNIPIVGETNNQ